MFCINHPSNLVSPSFSVVGEEGDSVEEVVTRSLHAIVIHPRCTLALILKVGNGGKLLRNLVDIKEANKQAIFYVGRSLTSAFTSFLICS